MASRKVMGAFSIPDGEAVFGRRWVVWTAVLALLVVSLLHRCFDLDSYVNVDAVGYWFDRTAAFWRAVEARDWKATFQSPHPGVPVMWISGAGLKLTGTMTGQATLAALVPATLPLAILNSALAPATFLMLLSLFGRSCGWLAFLCALLLATEPRLVAHARYFHLDMTTTMFSWFAVLASAVAAKTERVRWALFGGLCFGLAIVTRMSAVTVAAGCAVLFAHSGLYTRRHKAATLLLATGGAALATALLVWPGLLFEPGYVISNLVSKTDKWVEKGHQIFSWGKVYDSDPGAKHYLGILLMKLSQEVLIFTLPGVVALIKWGRQSRRTLLGLLMCYLPLVLILVVSNKKIGRYLMPVFPLFCLLGAAGILATANIVVCYAKRALTRLQTHTAILALLLLVASGRSARLAAAHPYIDPWCAKYPGLQCEDVMTLGFGEGMREAGLWISQHSPVKVPQLFVPRHAAAMRPWLKFRLAGRVRQAHFVVVNFSSHQRRVEYAALKRHVFHQKPVFTVTIADRPYVEVYLGPAHPNYPKPGVALTGATGNARQPDPANIKPGAELGAKEKKASGSDAGKPSNKPVTPEE